MEVILTSQAFMNALFIFGLRVVDMSLDTLRVLFVMRGRKPVVWVLGFLQATVFVVAITSVLSNLDNLLNIIGYAGGFATGNVLGMFLEEKLAYGHVLIRVISSRKSTAIAERLREAGYAVTEIAGRGRDGTVGILTVNVYRRKVAEVKNLALSIDPEAFITAEDIKPVRRGFWRA